MTCDSSEDACVAIKCTLSIIYEKPNEKNLDCSCKSDSEIKLNTNDSYFTQCILQVAVNNRKLCYFVVMDTHGKVIDIISSDDIMWNDIKEKLIAFNKNLFLRNFSGKSLLGLRFKMPNNKKKSLKHKQYFCQFL